MERKRKRIYPPSKDIPKDKPEESSEDEQEDNRGVTVIQIGTPSETD